MQRKSVNPVSRQAAAIRVPVTVRLPEKVVEQIDQELDQRDVPLSRNNWLLEAALEKLPERAVQWRTAMARSDLLISLVHAGNTGDKRGFRTVTEAIIAEERAKRHDVLADRLSKAIAPNGNGNGSQSPAITPIDSFSRGRDFISEVIPRRRLEDLVLSDAARENLREFVEEQHRADILRAHGLEPRNRVLLVGPPGTS